MLRYRLYEPQDFPQLQRLWEESTDWGALTPEFFRKHVEEHWFGPGAVCVAEDDATGRIEGELAFIPMQLSIHGREVQAFRPAAAILSKAVRAVSLDAARHPTWEMIRFLQESLQSAGHSLIFMKPERHWMLLLRCIPELVIGSYPLLSLSLPLAAPVPLKPGYSDGPLSAWDERVDRLWEAASRWYGCAVVRNAAILRLKVGAPQFDIRAVERGGELVGLVCSAGGRGEQWIICDLLATDAEALEAAVVTACNRAHASSLEADRKFPMAKVGILGAPIVEPIVRGLGFQRDRYDYPLALWILDKSIPMEDVAPSRWYLSAND
jgi:hypothetical protein